MKFVSIRRKRWVILPTRAKAIEGADIRVDCVITDIKMPGIDRSRFSGGSNTGSLHSRHL
jgi:hypothetical protein